MQLTNKWILLTGACGGIGEAAAAVLYQAGANLLLVGRQQARLDQLLADHKFSPNRVITIEADLNDFSTHKKIFDICNGLTSPLFGLINNAGISDFNLFEIQDDHTINQLIQTNLVSPMLLTKILLPLLKKADRAIIVNIGSAFGSIGHPGFAAYSASKFGFRGFNEALRRELADTSVRVCYLAPRATQTRINSDAVKQLNMELGSTTDSPTTVAYAVLDAIKKQKKITYLGWPEKLFIQINQCFPSIVDSALSKKLPIIKRFAKG